MAPVLEKLNLFLGENLRLKFLRLSLFHTARFSLKTLVDIFISLRLLVFPPLIV